MSEEESYRVMLGQIASLVTDFCEPEDTTLQGVARLVALFHDAKARTAWDYVEQLEEEARHDGRRI